MCGIAGIIEGDNRPVNVSQLEAMTQVLAHRGPDGEGYVLLSPRGDAKPIRSIGPLSDSIGLGPKGYAVGFGHRRLAILDLSPLGHQPMASPNGKYWVTYNGEIYNYLELREELRTRGYTFRSASDTEVLLTAYQEWGEECLPRLNGMFAFALWDTARRSLLCARDRFGEKPFYYWWDGRQFAFASEIKGLLPVVKEVRPNQQAVAEYLESGNLDDGSSTFFEGISQLLPGHFLKIQDEQIRIAKYWGLPEEHADARSLPTSVDAFQDVFFDAVRIRMRSDVPVGGCLSGGLDSSSIVCVVQENRKGNGPFHTFSSCFDNPTYDERPYIQSVVAHTGVQPHFAFPDPTELRDNVASLIWTQEEPFGSTSIFAQWNVMRLAKQMGVKVLLDGQGADELLGGYPSLFGTYYAELFSKGAWGRLLGEIGQYYRLHGKFGPYIPASFARSLLPPVFVQWVRSHITGSRKWVSAELRGKRGEAGKPPGGMSPSLRKHQCQLLAGTGLRALLHYEDRNSMAFGVEARLPFLDYRLVEMLFGLDNSCKIQNGWSKRILRDAMVGILPEQVRLRTDKMGFVTPEDIWFRTSLQGMTRDILQDPRTSQRGYLNVAEALKEFDAHVEGKKNLSSTIWRWVNLELWSRQFMDNSPCGESSS